MVLLPLLQDIEYAGDEKKSRRLNFYDYIYFMNGCELLKFKIELDHMDVVNVLEKYIESQRAFDKIIMSEKELKKAKIPLKFLYYLGNYRLENNLFKTKNYLAPKQTEFLYVIIGKYWDAIVDSTDLYNLNYIMNNTVCNEEDDTKKLIGDLFKSANVELVEKFEISQIELMNTINNIRGLFKKNRKYQDVLTKLKCILEKSKFNKEYIYNLGLEDKFNSAINKEREKQKVK